jgi:hypothetical protein
MAGELLLMGQAGEYNLPRAISRGDAGSAQLCAYEFVKSALHFIFLFNKAYQPYYKWQFRALAALPALSHLSDTLLTLLSSPASEAEIRTVTKAVTEALAEEGQIAKADISLEECAYKINDTVTDRTLRNLHILAGV